MTPKGTARRTRAMVAAAVLAMAWIVAASTAAWSNATEPEDEVLVVALEPRASVTGSVIRLSDVARRVSGPDELWDRLAELEVGTAPVPGQSRTLSRGTIEVRLRQARVGAGRVRWQDGPQDVFVTRAGFRLEPADAEQALQAYLAERPGGVGLRVVAGSLEMPVDVWLAPGSAPVRVVGGPPALGPGTAVFVLEAVAAGGPSKRVWVRVRLEEIAAATPGSAKVAAVEPAAWADAGSAPAGGEVPAGTRLMLVVQAGRVRVALEAVTERAGRTGTWVPVRGAGESAVTVTALLVSPELAIVQAAGPTGEPGI